MAKYIHIGNCIDFRNETAEKVPYGDVVALAGCIGIAAADIPAEGTGALHLTGVWELPATGEIALGERVYWDTELNLILAAPSPKATQVSAGIAVSDKSDSGEGVAWVRLAP